MVPHCSRRRLLSGVAGTVPLGTAGCTRLTRRGIGVRLASIGLLNRTPARRAVTLRLERGDERVLESRYDVPARTDVYVAPPGSDAISSDATVVAEEAWPTEPGRYRVSATDDSRSASLELTGSGCQELLVVLRDAELAFFRNQSAAGECSDAGPDS